MFLFTFLPFFFLLSYLPFCHSIFVVCGGHTPAYCTRLGSLGLTERNWTGLVVHVQILDEIHSD